MCAFDLPQRVEEVEPPRLDPEAQKEKRLPARCQQALGDARIEAIIGRIRRVRRGPDGIEDVVLQDGRHLKPDYIFRLLGSDPNTGPLRALSVTLSDSG